MGMIADRCERKWARWGGGLWNLFVLLLARKTRRATCERAVHEYTRRGAYD